MTPEQNNEIGRCIFREANDAFFVIHPTSLSVVDANPAAQRLSGLRKKQLLGLTLGELVESANGDDLAKLVRACQSTAHFVSAAGYFLKAANGSRRDVSVSVSRIHTEPEPMGLLIVRDVSPQRDAEQELANRETQFRVLVEQLPAIIWTLDRDLRITSSLGRGLAALGLRPNQLVGTHLFEYLKTNDPEFPPIAASRRAIEGEAVTYELCWQDRFYETRIEPLRGPNRRIIGCIGLSQDITERKQAEDTNRRSEKRFRDLFDCSPDAIFVEDLDGNVLDANRAACLLHQMPLEELVGKNVLEFVPPESRQQVAAEFPMLVRGERACVEGFSWTKDQRAVPVELRARLIDNDGKPALLIHVRDTSERKQYQERILQSQKLDAVGRLAGGIAHDFNNLLTVIIGFSDLLLGGPLTDADDTRQCITEIKNAGDQAASLIRQLLAFSRRQSLAPEVLSINSVVTTMESMLRRVLGGNIELTTVLSPDANPVKVDAGQIEQVVLNLVINARDAMTTGGSLRIETRNVEIEAVAGLEPAPIQAGSYVLLAVSDTGCGMDEQTKARIFEPFFTTKGMGQGTGLGLATIYGIIEQSGGHITVQSEVGDGTTFQVYLPRWIAQERSDEPQLRIPELPVGTETIVLAEDEPSVRAMAARVLRRCGYTVLEAENGAIALQIANEHSGPIHLLLTDVVMPEMDGRELADRLLPARPNMKILFISGSAPDDIEQMGVANRNAVLLKKPFTSVPLAQKVREVLDSGSVS